MPIRKPEKLHHLNERQNDWDGLADHELNFWQRVAKKTRGIITAANAVTMAGTVMVMNGLMDISQGNKGLGVAKIGAGRLADVADGEIAHRTGTKGNVGRVLDPTVDMVQLGVALPVLVSSDVMPIAAAAIVGIPKLATALGSATAFVRGQEINVPEEAKLGTAALWAGIGAFCLKAVLERHIPGSAETALEAFGWAGTVGGTAYQLPATKQYVQSGLSPQ